jgi:hypothetical protein
VADDLGNVILSATYNGITGSANIEVVNLVVDPGFVWAHPGEEITFTAIYTDSSGNEIQVSPSSWILGDTTYASLDTTTGTVTIDSNAPVGTSIELSVTHKATYNDISCCATIVILGVLLPGSYVFIDEGYDGTYISQLFDDGTLNPILPQIDNFTGMALKNDGTGLYVMDQESNIYFYEFSTGSFTSIGCFGPPDLNGYFSLACDDQGSLYTFKYSSGEVMKYDPSTDTSSVVVQHGTSHISTEINYVDTHIYLSAFLFYSDGSPWIFRIKNGAVETLANAPASPNGMHLANVVKPFKKDESSPLRVYSSDTSWGKIYLYIDTNEDGYFDVEKLFRDNSTGNDVVFGFGIRSDESLVADYVPNNGGIAGVHILKDDNADDDAEDQDEFIQITTWYSDEGFYSSYIVDQP